MDYNNLKEQLKGPVYPIPPAFTEGGALDLDATAKYVSYLLDNGASIIMVTAGTSRMNLLSSDEVKQLNEVVAQTVLKYKETGYSCLSIVGNQMIGSTQEAISFAKHAEDIKADYLLVYYPERFYEDEDIVQYYQDIADSTNLPILAHAMPIRNAKGGAIKAYDVPLLSKLANIPSFVGLKEESGNDPLQTKIGMVLSKRLAIIVAGGSMQMFLKSSLFGIQSYLVGIGSVYPKLEEQFYHLWKNKKYNDCTDLILKYEEPFFEIAKKFGWHVSMKCAMSHAEVMSDFERKPLRTATATQRSEIIACLKKMEIEK